MRSLYSGEEDDHRFLFETFDDFVSSIKKGFQSATRKLFLKRRFFELITRQRVISLRRFGRIIINRLDECYELQCAEFIYSVLMHASTTEMHAWACDCYRQCGDILLPTSCTHRLSGGPGVHFGGSSSLARVED